MFSAPRAPTLIDEAVERARHTSALKLRAIGRNFGSALSPSYSNPRRSSGKGPPDSGERTFPAILNFRSTGLDGKFRPRNASARAPGHGPPGSRGNKAKGFVPVRVARFRRCSAFSPCTENRRLSVIETAFGNNAVGVPQSRAADCLEIRL